MFSIITVSSCIYKWCVYMQWNNNMVLICFYSYTEYIDFFQSEPSLPKLVYSYLLLFTIALIDFFLFLPWFESLPFHTFILLCFLVLESSWVVSVNSYTYLIYRINSRWVINTTHLWLVECLDLGVWGKAYHVHVYIIWVFSGALLSLNILGLTWTHSTPL